MKQFFFAFLLLTVSCSIPVYLTLAAETNPPEVDEPLSPVDADKAILTGSTEPNAKIFVTGGLYEVPPVEADEKGNFSITVALPQESSSTFYIQSQLEGWELSDSVQVTIVEGEEATREYEKETGEDHTAPAAPEFEDTSIETTTGTYILQGTAEAGTSIWVNSVDSEETVNKEGEFSIELTLTGAGEKDTFNISVQDESGNLSSGTKVTITSNGGDSSIVEDDDKPALSDISGHWAEDYINRLYQLDIVSGYSDGRFGPDDKLTRAQMVKIALLSFDYPLGGGDLLTFSDVNPEEWFSAYVETAASLGIANGYSDNTFKPNAEVTRAEALKIMLMAAEADELGTTNASFIDVTPADWFKSYAAYAKEIGLISGYSDGTFRGNQSITRAEACKIIVELMDYLEQQE